MSTIRERKRIMESIKYTGLRFIAVLWVLGFGYTSTKTGIEQYNKMAELDKPWKMMREDFAVGVAMGKIESNENDPTFQMAKANKPSSE